MKTRYYVCGLGYDKNHYITDYEQSFGNFDTYEEAYELFVKLQCRKAESFFEKAPKVYQLLIQVEECEENEDGAECIDVKNECWIVNPNVAERNNLWVCDHCLMAIESREGNQAVLRHHIDEDDDVESRCDWCEEVGFDTLYELV
jgi:hypothetical protein